MPRRVIASNSMRAGRLVRPARLSLCAMALAMAAVPASAGPLTSAAALAQPLGGQSVADFYAARDHRPLWLQDGSGAAATALIDLLRTADADGLDPSRYPVGELSRSLRSAWGGSPAQVRQADRMLSEAFVAYVRDLKRTPQVAIVWVDPALKPKAPNPRALLDAAAKAPDLERWLADMRFMNPIYAGLRHAIARGEGGDPHLLRLNLERARALPSGPGRFILVNATAQRLTMYENGEPVDSMKVVVGKAKNPTPMMAAYVRFAALNPYWYVPPDLAAERIAPNVLKDGLHYLQRQGYQVMSDWADSGSVIDPETIDWQAVADGSKQVHIRQLPGPYNAMGQMKFMFPNDEGIYLHDTPQKELLTEASRLFSGGCVRLEDAPRLGRWLFGEPLQSDSKQAELTRSLPKPVPLFITYLTVMPSGTELATFPDIYGRDKQELAMTGSATMAVR
jgi:L,D-transpeptidase YcbB